MDRFGKQTTTSSPGQTQHVPVAVDVTPVEAEPIGAPQTVPDIDPDRRLSWMAWAAAVVLFIFNRKLGTVLFVILLAYRFGFSRRNRSKSD